MSDPFSRPYSPISTKAYGETDPKRVGVTRMDPISEHFCAVCGAGASFGFGGHCAAHKEQAERKWRRS